MKLSKMDLRRHELFESLILNGKQVFIELGIEEAIADQAATAFVDHLCHEWSGQTVAIPMDYSYRVALRDLEIYNFHKGDFNETARHFKMTERGVRKAFERVLKTVINKKQGRLFD